MDIKVVKQYLRIDTDADDDLIKLMMSAAEEYVAATVGKCDYNNFRTKILFLAVMQDFYENRTYTVTEAARRRLAHTQHSIIIQLQCEGDEEWLTLEGLTNESPS